MLNLYRSIRQNVIVEVIHKRHHLYQSNLKAWSFWSIKTAYDQTKVVSCWVNTVDYSSYPYLEWRTKCSIWTSLWSFWSSSFWLFIFGLFQIRSFFFKPDLQHVQYLRFHRWLFPWLSESLTDKYLTVNRLSHVTISPLYRSDWVFGQGQSLTHFSLNSTWSVTVCP